MQVWDKNGSIVYTKNLRECPISWCVTNQVLVYLPGKVDQLSADEFCYNIVYLYRDNYLIRVNVKGIPYLENIAQPILGFCNKCLYISHNYETDSDESAIYILNINELPSEVTANDFVN